MDFTMTARRATDWLAYDPKRDRTCDGDQRRAADRRETDRRAPLRKVDPLFVATLIRQITPDDETNPVRAARAYAPRGFYGRPGMMANERA